MSPVSIPEKVTALLAANVVKLPAAVAANVDMSHVPTLVVGLNETAKQSTTPAAATGFPVPVATALMVSPTVPSAPPKLKLPPNACMEFAPLFANTMIVPTEAPVLLRAPGDGTIFGSFTESLPEATVSTRLICAPNW